MEGERFGRPKYAMFRIRLRRMRRALAILALALAGAAPRVGDPGCPLPGEGTWRELETEHFVLATDLPPDGADDLAQQLEVLRSAVLGGLFDVPPSVPGRLHVVAFARVEDFRRFAPKPVDGFFARSRDGHTVIVARADVGRVTRAEIVAHELTHAVVAVALARRPTWLDEGLATYMEGVGEVSDGELVAVGAPPARRLAAARRDRASVASVLSARGHLDPDQYATSWLLVHYLLAQHRDRFVAYEMRLAAGQEPAAAWREAFPEWDPASVASVEALERSLVRYVRDDGRYAEMRFPARGDGAHRVSTMSATEVAELCRRLPRWSGQGTP